MTETPMAPPLTNLYSGEHRVRQDVLDAVADKGFIVESYGMSDKAALRTLTIGLDGFGGDDRPLFMRAIEAALAAHGYELDSVKVTAKASKVVTNQTVLNFASAADGHPDNV